MKNRSAFVRFLFQFHNLMIYILLAAARVTGFRLHEVVDMADYKQGLASACDNITNAVISGKVTDLGSSDAAALALYARHLKRIAAHSRNIISSVVNPFPRLGYKEKSQES